MPFKTIEDEGEKPKDNAAREVMKIACRTNILRLTQEGKTFRPPNGSRGTVLFCPWPGCTNHAVSGWNSCSAHFNDVRESFRCSSDKPTVQSLPFVEKLLSRIRELESELSLLKKSGIELL